MPVSPWPERLKLLADRITEPCRVLDVGAGNQALCELLLDGSVYTSLDLFPYEDEFPVPDILCNLERRRDIPGAYDVAVIAGLLEHVTNPTAILKAVAGVAPRILFSYADADEVPPHIRNGWKSCLYEADILRVPGTMKFGQWQDHSLYEWRQGAAAAQQRGPRP